MSDACGCGHDSSPGDDTEEGEPQRLRDVSELRAAAAAGMLLAAGLLANLADSSTVELVFNAGALLVGASTFVPGSLKRLRRGKIGVGTLMTIAAVGAVILGQVGEAAMLAFLYSISEGMEEYSLARTRRGLRALLSLVPEQATVVRDGVEITVSPGDLRLGERMLVRPGERLATDGVVRSGRSILVLVSRPLLGPGRPAPRPCQILGRLRALRQGPVKRRPQPLGQCLFDEVVALGYDRSYPSCVRQIRVRGVHPQCEACR